MFYRKLNSDYLLHIEATFQPYYCGAYYVAPAEVQLLVSNL